MKAMILSAGLGSRLYPYTKNKPKALVQINNKTQLEIVIMRLIKYGFHDIIINIHHFASQIIDYLNANNNFGCSITISDESDCLLDTGGGMKKAAWFFDDGNPFLVHNVDVYTTLDLTQLYQAHQKADTLATLAVKSRTTTRPFLINSENIICGWRNTSTGEERIVREEDQPLTPIGFSGIQVLHPKLFSYITEEGTFSMTDVYLRLAEDHDILAFHHDDDVWIDMGKKENLQKVKEFIV